MALTKCPECNKEISDKSLSCIGCGCPVEQRGNKNEPLSSDVTETSIPPPFAVPFPETEKTPNYTQSDQSSAPKYSPNYQTNTLSPFSFYNSRHYSSRGAKRAKLIFGIVSIAIFCIIILQSYAVDLANLFSGNINDVRELPVLLLGFLLLIGGIIGITTRRGKNGGIAAGIIYLLGAVIGFSNLNLVIFTDPTAYAIFFELGIFTDLFIRYIYAFLWSVLALVFCITFIGLSVETIKSRIIWVSSILFICTLSIALPIINEAPSERGSYISGVPDKQTIITTPTPPLTPASTPSAEVTSSPTQTPNPNNQSGGGQSSGNTQTTSPATPEPTTTPEPAPTASRYQQIYNEYAQKIRTAAPTSSIMELAEVTNEGILKMAEYMFSASGTDGQYATYEEWAGKLYDVYMAEAR
ncbi:MAG: hypothetical protein FWD44_04965 [Oscillospiraceae bacterium]|nr:hypothetical protein [Oscillospiraceae bacterium]